MFEPLICENLEAYVYALIDPRTKLPFYIGKGRGNRVFSHVACALKEPTANDKYDTIREIVNSGLKVEHVIIRHGLTDQSAFEVESALIDFCGIIDQSVANIALGHHSTAFGAMTSDAIIRKYKSEPLSRIEEGFVLININKTYRRAKGQKSYYEATKESWAIKKTRVPNLKYALSEYKGFVVEVFKIADWYTVEVKGKNGKARTRWGFNGVVAEDEVRALYLNRSVRKRPGAANPIRYNYIAKTSVRQRKVSGA